MAADPGSTASILTERMPRIDSLTGLRWWAAFAVFAYHMMVFAALPNIISVFLQFGFLGVTFFFVLSGFVLTWSASMRIPQSTFYWRRFARIYPSHFVALLFAIPVFYSFSPDPAQTWVKPVSLGILALSFVLLQGWWSNPTVLFSGNPAAWTLACEAFFYAVHPYVSKFLNTLRIRGSLVFVAVAIALTFAYRLLAVATPGTWFSQLPLPVTDLPEFAIGMALAWAFRCGWRPRIPISFGLGIMVGCVALIALTGHLAPKSSFTVLISPYSNELFTVGCAIAIVAFASRSLQGRRSIFASKVFVLLGEWSYAFYLVHATFIYIALSCLGRQPTGWSNILWYLVLLAIAIGGAAALHYGIEKPFERRMRAWKDARTSR
jgi:peptidoglycan/LPS O-acetylase OafA/YrhL